MDFHADNQPLTARYCTTLANSKLMRRDSSFACVCNTYRGGDPMKIGFAFVIPAPMALSGWIERPSLLLAVGESLADNSIEFSTSHLPRLMLVARRHAVSHTNSTLVGRTRSSAPWRSSRDRLSRSGSRPGCEMRAPRARSLEGRAPRLTLAGWPSFGGTGSHGRRCAAPLM